MQETIKENIAANLKAVSEYYVPSTNFDKELLALDRWWMEKWIKGPNILEMGCSDGTSTKVLLGIASSLHVIDGSPDYLALTHASLPAGASVTMTCTFYENFVPDCLFDDIVFARSLDHCDDPQLVLDRVKTWLKPGGRLHIVVQNAQSLHRRFSVASGEIPHCEYLTEHNRRMNHKRVYTKASLLSALKASKWRVGFFRGYVLKPFGYDALGKIAGHDREAFIKALHEVSRDLPDELCCQFYALCQV